MKSCLALLIFFSFLLECLDDLLAEDGDGEDADRLAAGVVEGKHLERIIQISSFIYFATSNIDL